MPARKLFVILMGLLAYLLITLLWFAYTVPELLAQGTEACLIAAGFGSMAWLCASGCIVIHIIQRARP